MSALAGVRLVSLALNVPGPVAVARLAGEGAAVVKVEPPGGDPLQVYAPAWYDALHAVIDVRAVDLKTNTGRHTLDELLASAVVLVTSQRPAALARLRLDPAALRQRHPGLRGVAIVGDTREPDVAGHDLTYQADAGLVDDRLPATLVADLAGAERTVSAVLLALREAPGTFRQVGLRDSLDVFRTPRQLALTTPGGPFGGADPAYQVYRAADGVVALAALEPHFRARLYTALDLPLDAPLADVIATRSCDEWATFARAHDVPLSVVPRA
jgi:crotonobetainyl-CoA:carnitine CoA-transferase CaiB-like acyl-CoA transferase